MIEDPNSGITYSMFRWSRTNLRAISDSEVWKYSCGRVGLCVWIKDSEITYPKIETSAVKINKTRGNAAILFDKMFEEGIVPKTLWSSYIDI